MNIEFDIRDLLAAGNLVVDPRVNRTVTGNRPPRDIDSGEHIIVGETGGGHRVEDCFESSFEECHGTAPLFGFVRLKIYHKYEKSQ